MKNLINHRLLTVLLLSTTLFNSSFTQNYNSDELLVLSYNICWQCMTNTPAGTAKNLGEACVYSDLNYPTTVCAERMGKFIETIPGNSGVVNYDFVGLQEASKWQSILKLAPNTLGKMEFETSQSGHEMMVTFYDPKYTLLQAIKGEFESGRPFQVLIFKENIIFINLHNNHKYNMNHIQGSLSQSLTDNLHKNIDIRDLVNSRIIVVGDFNFGGNDEIAIKPFAGTIVQTESWLRNPAISCCDEYVPSIKDPWEGYRSGDFIFDSKGIAIPIRPTGYDSTSTQSDHIPVISLLDR